jgi:hypothetical protein
MSLRNRRLTRVYECHQRSKRSVKSRVRCAVHVMTKYVLFALQALELIKRFEAGAGERDRHM